MEFSVLSLDRQAARPARQLIVWAAEGSAALGTGHEDCLILVRGRTEEMPRRRGARIASAVPFWLAVTNAGAPSTITRERLEIHQTPPARAREMRGPSERRFPVDWLAATRSSL